MGPQDRPGCLWGPGGHTGTVWETHRDCVGDTQGLCGRHTRTGVRTGSGRHWEPGTFSFKFLTFFHKKMLFFLPKTQILVRKSLGRSRQTPEVAGTTPGGPQGLFGRPQGFVAGHKASWEPKGPGRDRPGHPKNIRFGTNGVGKAPSDPLPRPK